MNQDTNYEAVREQGLGSQSKSKLSTIKESVAQGLQSVSDNIRKSTGQRENAIATSLAASIDDAAGYLRNLDPEKLGDQFQDGVRRHPGRSLLIAGAAGLLLGAWIRR
ncbi:MAG: hypothetical protein DMF61_02940 [Blastocatellia bacterium AA13]|nr:MAG: hypothetical protein DMF61_02940 [Blastocatellia bacterium AA13]